MTTGYLCSQVDATRHLPGVLERLGKPLSMCLPVGCILSALADLAPCLCSVLSWCGSEVTVASTAALTLIMRLCHRTSRGHSDSNTEISVFLCFGCPNSFIEPTNVMLTTRRGAQVRRAGSRTASCFMSPVGLNGPETPESELK